MCKIYIPKSCLKISGYWSKYALMQFQIIDTPFSFSFWFCFLSTCLPQSPELLSTGACCLAFRKQPDGDSQPCPRISGQDGEQSELVVKTLRVLEFLVGLWIYEYIHKIPALLHSLWNSKCLYYFATVMLARITIKSISKDEKIDEWFKNSRSWLSTSSVLFGLRSSVSETWHNTSLCRYLELSKYFLHFHIHYRIRMSCWELLKSPESLDTRES